MKKLLLIIVLMTSVGAFAYEDWDKYTPQTIFSEISFGSIAQRKLIIRTKGSVNSCGGLERNQYKMKVVSCSDDLLELAADFKNGVSCDMGMLVDHKFKVKLPKDCFKNTAFGMGFSGKISINGKVFDEH